MKHVFSISTSSVGLSFLCTFTCHYIYIARQVPFTLKSIHTDSPYIHVSMCVREAWFWDLKPLLWGSTEESEHGVSTTYMFSCIRHSKFLIFQCIHHIYTKLHLNQEWTPICLFSQSTLAKYNKTLLISTFRYCIIILYSTL